MRKAWRIWGWACLLTLGFASLAVAQVQFGVSANDQGVNSFYLSIGDYYHVPQQQVQVCVQRRIPDEEIPVAFFIAQRANVSPQAVIDFRLTGQPWLQVALHFGLQPDVFYVPVNTRVSGPPYGNAYGYWRNKKLKRGKFRWSDEDVVNFVNLRFMSEHYGYTPEQVIKLRSGGKRFREINDEFRGKKNRGHNEGDQGGDGDHGQGHNKHKNKKWNDDQGRGNDQNGDMNQDSDHGHGRGHGRDKGDDGDQHGRGRGNDDN